MIKIAGLRALSDGLTRLDMTAAQQVGLERAARMIQGAVQDSLATPPGGDHTAPWRRTGPLQASIEHQADTTDAAIGSDDPVAVDQELGTRTTPPRPFLSTTAAAHAQDAAHQVAISVVEAIRDAINGAKL